MKKTLYFPLYDEDLNRNGEEFPIKVLKLNDIFYDVEDSSVVAVGKSWDEGDYCYDGSGHKFKKYAFCIPMTVSEYNKIVQCMFDNNQIWINKAGYFSDEFDDEIDEAVKKYNNMSNISIISGK